MLGLKKTSEDFEDDKEYLALLAANELKHLSSSGVFYDSKLISVFDLVLRINDAYGFTHKDYETIEIKLDLAKSDVEDAEPNNELNI